MTRKIEVRNFHQAKWDEPVIFELSNKGERGILFPELEMYQWGDAIMNVSALQISKCCVQKH